MSASAGVVTIPEGEDLVEALRSAGAGWVAAVGTVHAVELRAAGEGADPTRALRGRWTLVSLTGPGSGPWGVVLSRATDTGLELVGGELVRATSLGVELALPSATSRSSGPVALPHATTPRPAPVEDPIRERPTAAASWAAAANASARAQRAASLSEDPIVPEPNDLVRHFAFGLCEVLMADDERLKIRDLEGPGRIREIKLDMLRVKGPTDQDGKRLFHLERKM